MSDLRPPGYYVTGTHGPGVEVPGRVCAWLEAKLDLQRLRVDARGMDPEVDSVLADLHRVALVWRSRETLPRSGSEQAEPAEADAVCSWLTTADAAGRLGVTTSRVRQVIRAKHLVAEQVDHRWRISRQDFEHYRAARAA